MTKKSSTDLVSNRKAHHNYEILETFEAGIVLQGTEIKSLRDHGGQIDEAYIIVSQGEVWLKNASIAPYSHGNIHNHEEKRDRKLLFHSREILRLKQALDQKGLTLIPLSLYMKAGKVKVKVALAKGKKLYDKRAALKKREDAKSVQKAIKDYK